MDIQHLEIFVNLAENLNYSKTAENMHISQPAVSQIIKKIEQELGVQLFYRSRREVRLTENGEIFYEDTKSLLNSYNKSVQRTRNAFTRAKSNLTIGLTETPFEINYIPKKVQSFRRIYPEYKVFLEGYDHNRLKQMLADHNCDVILTTEDDIAGSDDLDFNYLTDGCFVALVPKTNPLSQKKSLNITDFTDQSLILMDSNWCPPNQLQLQELIRKSVSGLDIAYVNDVISGKMMVEAGLGMTLMPSFVSEKANELSIPVKINYDVDLSYGIVRRRDETNKAVLDFIDFLIKN